MLDVGGGEVEALAGGWLGGGQAGDAAGVGGGRLVVQLDDVGAAHFLRGRGECHAGDQREHGEGDGTQFHLFKSLFCMRETTTRS